MNRPPRRSTLFPHTTLSQSSPATSHAGQGVTRSAWDGDAGRVRRRATTGTNPEATKSHTTSDAVQAVTTDRKSTRLNSSHGYISYAVFCLKKKKNEHEKSVS